MHVPIELNGLQYLIVFNLKICVFTSIMLYDYKGVSAYHFHSGLIKRYRL